MGEFLFQIVFEVGAYFIGKGFVATFIPGIGIEKLAKQKSSSKWKWKGLTYKKGDKKYFYTEAIQMIGLAVIVVSFLFIIGVFKYAN